MFGLSKNKLCLEATIPKAGYVIGDIILIELKVTNTTASVIIEEIAFRLVLTTIYTARIQEMNHVERLSIASEKIPKEKIANQCILKVKLTVPPTIPTSLELNEILKISYTVEISTRVDSKLHTMKDIKLPITIGVIPFGVTRKAKLVKKQSFCLDNFELGKQEVTILKYSRE